MDRFWKDRALIYLQQTSRNLKLKDSVQRKWQAVFSVRPRIRGDFGFKTVTSAQSHTRTHAAVPITLLWIQLDIFSSFKQAAVASLRTQSRLTDNKELILQKRRTIFLSQKRKNAPPKRLGGGERSLQSWSSVCPGNQNGEFAVAPENVRISQTPPLFLNTPPTVVSAHNSILSFTVLKVPQEF